MQYLPFFTHSNNMYFLYISKNALTNTIKTYIIDVIANIATRCCGMTRMGGKSLYNAASGRIRTLRS